LTPCLPTLWRTRIPFFRSIRVIGLVPEIPPTGVNPLFWGLGGLEPGSTGYFLYAGLVEGLYAIRMPYLTPSESSWKLFYRPGNMPPPGYNLAECCFATATACVVLMFEGSNMAQFVHLRLFYQEFARLLNLKKYF
jgi:hypothetical protein